MSRIDRRNMLKLMAATGAGAAAAASSGLLNPVTGFAASAPRLHATNGTNNNNSTYSGPHGPKIAATAGVIYRNFGGIDFKPRSGSTTYVWAGDAGISLSAGLDYVPVKLDLPNASVITEASAWVENGVAGTTLFDLTHFAADRSNYTDYASTSTTTVNATVQRLDLSFAPLKVDTTTNSYVILWKPGALNPFDILWGARVGYVNAPGITLFPDPRRIVSGDLTPFTSGITYGPFDATVKAGGAIASGVPAGAQAAFCAVQSFTPGVLGLFPDLTVDPGIANYSGTGNLGTGLNMVYMMVPLSPGGKFKIHSYITGKVYIDAWGFVFPPG